MTKKDEIDNIPAMLTEGEYVIKKDSAQKLGYKNLEKMNATGDLPTYDAGGRVQNIKGYGDGGKVTYLEVEPGKFEKQHHFSKQVELSRERDIKNQAKGIASGKYKNLDITNITKSVEAKEREAVRQHKVSKELDRIYEAKKLKEKAKAEAEKLKKKRKKKKKKKK